MIGILGTGSNSCFFDGTRIAKQIPSLGFPLGDEGSGADIGKACVRAFYYDLMPSGIRDSFARVLPADRSVFLRQYLDHPAPNKFLAELVPVVIEHLQAPFIRGLLLECFRTFARLHLKPYRIEAPVHLSGGVAYACQELLRNVLLEEQFIPGSIVISPLPGLIKFHQAHFEDINE